MANLSSYDQQTLFGSNITLSHLLSEDDLCFVIKQEIGPLIKDSDFESMYKDGGRPPVSPRMLILVLLMQFLEGLSDRAAVRNLKFRWDWKIAFGLAVDFEGVHSSTLTYFRDRLLANEKSSLVFDRILDHLKRCGLIKAGGKQRIDSTHVVAVVRELSRIELLRETLRLFCQDAEAFKSSMDESILGIYQSCMDRISVYGMGAEEKKSAIERAGISMRVLICWVESNSGLVFLVSKESFKTLKTVFSQNFT